MKQEENGGGGDGVGNGGHVVWVGSVPSSLCANQNAVKEVFAVYGQVLSVKVHHNLVDMSTDGFIYVEYSSAREAAIAVEAVKTGSIDPYPQMRASMAFRRGPLVYEPDNDISDLLLGRRQAGLMNAFSQQNSAEDEDDYFLQSLSQPSFGSQKRRKRTKKSK